MLKQKLYQTARIIPTPHHRIALPVFPPDLKTGRIGGLICIRVISLKKVENYSPVVQDSPVILIREALSAAPQMAPAQGRLRFYSY